MTFCDPDENELFDRWLKYRRDEAARMEAEVERAVETAVAKVTETARMAARVALEKARLTGRESLEKRDLIIEVCFLQKLLKRTISEKTELVQLSKEELLSMVHELEKELSQQNS